MNYSNTSQHDPLEQGNYLIEMNFNTEVALDVIRKGLEKIGFDPEDLILGNETKLPKINKSVFIGKLTRPILPIETESVKWNYIHKIIINPFSELTLQVQFQSLETDKVYEIRFVARMKSDPTLADVERSLTSMGFSPQKLCLLKKDIRLPGRPNASCTLWYGVAKWTGPSSYITDQDPFFFDDVVPVDGQTADGQDEQESEKESPQSPLASSSTLASAEETAAQLAEGR